MEALLSQCENYEKCYDIYNLMVGTVLNPKFVEALKENTQKISLFLSQSLILLYTLIIILNALGSELFSNPCRPRQGKIARSVQKFDVKILLQSLILNMPWIVGPLTIYLINAHQPSFQNIFALCFLIMDFSLAALFSVIWPLNDANSFLKILCSFMLMPLMLAITSIFSLDVALARTSYGISQNMQVMCAVLSVMLMIMEWVKFRAHRLSEEKSQSIHADNKKPCSVHIYRLLKFLSVFILNGSSLFLVFAIEDFICLVNLLMNRIFAQQS